LGRVTSGLRKSSGRNNERAGSARENDVCGYGYEGIRENERLGKGVEIAGEIIEKTWFQMIYLRCTGTFGLNLMALVRIQVILVTVLTLKGSSDVTWSVMGRIG
jgi:hypothetical protein